MELSICSTAADRHADHYATGLKSNLQILNIQSTDFHNGGFAKNCECDKMYIGQNN